MCYQGWRGEGAATTHAQPVSRYTVCRPPPSTSELNRPHLQAVVTSSVRSGARARVSEWTVVR